jgi:signal transduction histidine kinase
MSAYPQALDRRYVQTLLRLRWVAAGGICLGLISYEIIEHHPVWNDLEFWLESITFGVIMPFMVWLSLTLRASQITRRLKSQEHLALYQFFTQRLVQSREWEALTRFLTEFLGLVLSAEHTALFIYNHPNARLEFVTDWNASTQQASPLNRVPADVKLCRTCLVSGMRHTAACEFTHDPGRHELAGQWCVPLRYNNLLVGILRGRCQPGKTLTPDQIEFLDACSPEMALAVALAISHPRQMAQVRASARLEERRRFAWVMHNTLAQQIGSLHLSLDRLAKDDRFPKTPESRDELDYLGRVAGEAYELTRDILMLLRPEGTTDLTQVIAGYARLVAQRANLRLDFATQGEAPVLPPQVRQQIFSLVQEGLNNIEKHARAEHVQLTLDWSAEGLSISLADDGVGFNPSAFSQDGHYGIVMMHEEVEALAGKLTILSSPRQGTQLEFRIPLQRLTAIPENGKVLAASPVPMPASP